MQYSIRNRTAHGFTLIELMIAIAVVGILVTIALPSYNNYVLRSGRADAKAVLFGAAQTLERCYTRFSAYNDGDCALAQGDTVDSENGKYELTVTRVTATEFDLTAAPKGAQTKDAKCANFTLDHTGDKGVSGSGSVDDCW